MVDTIFPTPGTYTPRQGRQTVAPAYAGATAARPLGALTGVRPGTPASTVTATTSLVTVQPFAGTADVQTLGIAGPYEFAFDFVYTVALAAQSASVACTDIVYVQINDNQEDGTGALNSSSATRVYLPASRSTGTIPTLPNSRCFTVATINVPIVGSAPTVTWVAPYTVAAGGTLPANTLAQLNTITGSSSLQYAEVIADPITSNNGTYKWFGGAWTARGMAWPSVLASVAILTASTMTSIMTLTLPTTAPSGKYRISAYVVSAATAAGAHYWQLVAGGTFLTTGDSLNGNTGGVDLTRSDTFSYDHAGGALSIVLSVQVNASGPVVRAGTRLMAAWVG